MLVVDFVDAHEDALLILAHVGEAFEVHGHGHFEVERFDLGDRLGQEVVVGEGGDRQVEAHHAAALLGPEAASVHHMLGFDRAFLGDDFPVVAFPVQLFDFVVFDDVPACFSY